MAGRNAPTRVQPYVHNKDVASGNNLEQVGINLRIHRHINRKLLCKFARQCLRVIFIRINSPAGQLPFIAPVFTSSTRPSSSNTPLIDVGYVAEWDRSELSMNYFSVKLQGIFHSNTLTGLNSSNVKYREAVCSALSNNFSTAKLSAEDKGV